MKLPCNALSSCFPKFAVLAYLVASYAEQQAAKSNDKVLKTRDIIS